MDSLPTINKLGYATVDERHLHIYPESGHGSLVFLGMESHWLVANIIACLTTPVALRIGVSYRLEFSPYNVYILWDSNSGVETAVFDEADLVKLINIRMLRNLVLSRKTSHH